MDKVGGGLNEAPRNKFQSAKLTRIILIRRGFLQNQADRGQKLWSPFQ